ncbi:MFS transporter [Nocardia sp. NPDC051052]|uniref:MFS transporter n=1 Tax=Nocardia sp. NPDC051052 TaxID=3364322 RepID=UPI0037A656BB
MADQSRTYDGAVVPGAGTRTARRGVALTALAAAQFMVVLDSTIVNVALPSIRDDLGLSPASLSWVVDGYLVAFGGLLLLGGRLADVFRRRTVFLAGLAMFVASSVACALATTGPLLIGARVLHGAGGAVMAPAALSIVMTLFPDGPDRARALGVWGGVSGAGGIAGVLLGGVLSQTLGWPWIFLINVPVGVLVAMAAVGSVRSLPAAGGAFDIAGAVTVTLSMAALAYGLVSGPQEGWTSWITLGALAVGLVALVAFLGIERRAAGPLVPLQVFARARLSTANTIMLLVGAVTVGMFYFLPQYQQLVLGMSPIETSLAQLPIAGTITGGGLLAPRIARAVGIRPALVGGLVSLVVGALWLAMRAATTFAGLVGPFLLIGAGIGVSFVYVTSLAVADSLPSEAGLVSGLVNTTRQMGGALGLATMVAVATGDTPTPHFSAAFAAAAALTGLALLLSLTPALRER